MLEWHTGTDTFVRPSMGSWITYGLGSESRDLPGFIVCGDQHRQAVRRRPGRGCLPPLLRFLAGVEDAQGDDVCQGAVVIFAVIPRRRNLLA